MARQVCEENKSRDMASSAGFCYSDNNTTMQTHLANQIQGCFVSDPEMFNLTAGMEMIGFHKNLQHQQQSDHSNAVIWKSFFAKPGQHQGEHLPPQQGPSSSKTMNHPSSSSTNFYHEYNTSGDQNLIVGGGTHDSVSATWQQDNRSLMVDDSSLRCVFPCEGNERPSQGLSLSLSSNNPSSIGLQSFELRQTTNLHQPQPPADRDFVSANPREGFFVKSANTHHDAQQQQQMLQQQDGYLSANKAASLYHGGHFILKNSKYLVPAQELLNEFCSLGSTKQGDDLPKQKSQKNKESWEEEDNNGSGSSSSKKHSLTSLELAEFQKRKTKLLSMLEEVDRRYRHYRNQMKAVVSSFEAVAGNGAARVYSALALRAMSRHFRCLKDGILGQIHATRKAMGEKDTVAPGTTRGETPRLKLIDQTLRQQRAFQQMNMMETHPWRPQRGLPERSVSLLRAWLFEHFLHPYPSDVDKHILARQTGLSRSQVSNWFINARVRLWKPMVEEMYLEEMKEHENNMASSEWGSDPEHVLENVPPHQDQKPNPERLIRIDSECASSSIIINQDSTKNDPKSKTLNLNPQEQQCLGRVTDTSFGSVELDFSSYTSGMVSYGGGSSSNSGVSLTLGLQQHAAGGGSGVSLAFPPPPHQGSLLYQTRDQIEECQPVQYSLLDGEAQNLPYRNLMGAQLLHDLAG